MNQLLVYNHQGQPHAFQLKHAFFVKARSNLCPSPSGGGFSFFFFLHEELFCVQFLGVLL